MLFRSDIDFKVSELIKSDLKKYFWNKKVSPGYEFSQNKSLETYTTVLNSYTESAGGLTKEAQLKRVHGDFWWNEVKIPNIDAYGNKMFSKMFEERNIEIDILKTETKSGADTKVIIQTNTFSAEVSEDDNFIVLTPKALQDGTVDFDDIEQFNIVLPNTNDFYSSTTFSPYKTDEYNLSSDQIKSIQSLVDDWLANKLYTITSAQRAIYLPYTVTSSNVNTREETIMRKGSISLDNEMTLSENSFWNYLVPKIIDTYYAGKIKADSNIYDGEWEHITNLIMDIYPKIKPGICDSILDNNNNITNFSTQMERACLRNIINVQYYQDN